MLQHKNRSRIPYKPSRVFLVLFVVNQSTRINYSSIDYPSISPSVLVANPTWSGLSQLGRSGGQRDRPASAEYEHL